MVSDEIDPELLDEQLEYYRQRASEYDEWWERRGRYDRGPEINARWRAEIEVVLEAFDGLPFDGQVLELAPGTGYWTELLAQRADTVTALDGSAEMIALNRTRLGHLAAKVDYREVDLFDWVPDRRWDGLVFCFWISHVPRGRLAGFLLQVPAGARRRSSGVLPRRAEGRGEHRCRPRAPRPRQRGDGAPAQRRP